MPGIVTKPSRFARKPCFRPPSAGRLGAGPGRLALAFGLPFLLSACYVIQAASGQLDIGRRSRPIDAVVQDPTTDRQTRERLSLVLEVRNFAVERLRLPDGDSYLEYANLDRDYAVWNVVATPEFSVSPRTWCFPVAGCVSYRGYFKEASARSAAARYARRGDDVLVGGVAAYSTLGYFSDPVLSTMLEWSELRLVRTIFHELAHEQLYVQDDSKFNESFASVVGEEGVRLWLKSRGRDEEIGAFESKLRREDEFVALLADARRQLAGLYAGDLPGDRMRVEKQRVFGRLKFDYERLRISWHGYRGFDRWFDRTLNNAHLAAVATYHDCLPGLRRELALAGSLPAFYERAARFAEVSRNERREKLCRPRPQARRSDHRAMHAR